MVDANEVLGSNRSQPEQGRALQFERGGGVQFKAMPAEPDIFSLRKRKTGSLKVITSVFRPKSGEKQKKSLRPQIVFYTYSISPLHHKSFVHLSAGGRGPSPPGYAPAEVGQTTN